MLKKIKTVIAITSIVRLASKLKRLGEQPIDPKDMARAQSIYNTCIDNIQQKNYRDSEKIDNSILMLAAMNFSAYLHKNLDLDISDDVIRQTLKVGNFTEPEARSLNDILKCRYLTRNADSMTPDEIRENRVYFAKSSTESSAVNYAKLNVAFCHFALDETRYAGQKIDELIASGNTAIIKGSKSRNDSKIFEEFLLFSKDRIIISSRKPKI